LNLTWREILHRQEHIALDAADHGRVPETQSLDGTAYGFEQRNGDVLLPHWSYLPFARPRRISTSKCMAKRLQWLGATARSAGSSMELRGAVSAVRG